MAAKFDKLDEGKYQLDVRGMTCPHPQLYTKKSLEKIQEGDSKQRVQSTQESRILSEISHDYWMSTIWHNYIIQGDK